MLDSLFLTSDMYPLSAFSAGSWWQEAERRQEGWDQVHFFSGDVLSELLLPISPHYLLVITS